MMARKTITDLYVRICRDSGHTLDYIRAAHFVADLLKVSALEVWIAMGSFDAMQRVANGTHPACGDVLTQAQGGASPTSADLAPVRKDGAE